MASAVFWRQSRGDSRHSQEVAGILSGRDFLDDC